MGGCKTLECMQERPVEEFERCHFADPMFWIGKTGQYFAGFDGEVLPRPMLEMLCTGKTNDVDIIAGTVPFEWRSDQAEHLKHAGDDFAKFDPTFPEPAGGMMPMGGAIHEFLVEYVDGYAQRDNGTQRCVTEKLIGLYKDATKYNTCPNCTEFNTSSMIRQMSLATDIEATLGAQLLAQSSGGGRRYRYLFDSEGDGQPFGAAHGAEMTYFCKSPGSQSENCTDGSNSTPLARVALGKELRRRWTTFAKTGVPGKNWPEVSRHSGRRAVPMLHMRLDGQTVEHSAWFSDIAAELLADLACGKRGINDFDCGEDVSV